MSVSNVIDLTARAIDPDMDIVVRIADGGAGTLYVLPRVSVLQDEGLAYQPGGFVICRGRNAYDNVYTECGSRFTHPEHAIAWPSCSHHTPGCMDAADLDGGHSDECIANNYTPMGDWLSRLVLPEHKELSYDEAHACATDLLPCAAHAPRRMENIAGTFTLVT